MSEARSETNEAREATGGITVPEQTTYFKVDDTEGVPPLYIRYRVRHVGEAPALYIERFDPDESKGVDDASCAEYVLGESLSGVSQIEESEAPKA